MPTTRKRVSRRAGSRITPAVIEAFKARDGAALDRLLGIKPWEPSPLQTRTPEPPEGMRHGGTAWAEAWPKVYQLRQEIEAAANG